MRILVTADPEIPVPPVLYGGIERVVDWLICGLRARGHEVGLVAHEDSTCSTDFFRPWPGKRSQKGLDLIRNMAALGGAVKQFKPDVLHSFSRVAYLLPHLPQRSLPKIMSYQRFPSRRSSRLGAMLSSGSLTFTGCSEYICTLGRQGGGEWHAIHNGVELEKFDFVPSVPEDAPLVFLSRLDRIKGAHMAIAAARRTGRRLLIAGNHATEGSEHRYFQEEIEPYLGKEGIEYVGSVNDAQKNQLLGTAAAMIVPIEWHEPFGIVFAESLACGTPVISSPNGALPEIVRQGMDGFLVRGLDEAVQAIERLPEIDRNTCRQRAEQCFSSSVIVGKYEALYARSAGYGVSPAAACKMQDADTNKHPPEGAVRSSP